MLYLIVSVTQFCWRTQNGCNIYVRIYAWYLSLGYVWYHSTSQSSDKYMQRTFIYVLVSDAFLSRLISHSLLHEGERIKAKNFYQRSDCGVTWKICVQLTLINSKFRIFKWTRYFSPLKSPKIKKADPRLHNNKSY